MNDTMILVLNMKTSMWKNKTLPRGSVNFFKCLGNGSIHQDGMISVTLITLTCNLELFCVLEYPQKHQKWCKYSYIFCLQEDTLTSLALENI